MEKFIEQVEQMSNEELYREVLVASEPDDYDGVFTDEGHRKLGILKAQFESRLLKCGFLQG
jgi:hypothetical protein